MEGFLPGGQMAAQLGVASFGARLHLAEVLYDIGLLPRTTSLGTLGGHHLGRATTPESHRRLVAQLLPLDRELQTPGAKNPPIAQERRLPKHDTETAGVLNRTTRRQGKVARPKDISKTCFDGN